jgi:O-antigen chain-terminating methyltransferase
VLAQVREYAGHVNELLRTLAYAVEGPPQHVHDDLWERIDGLLERAADTERMAAGGPAAVAALADRVAALEARTRAGDFHPWYSADAFEAAFRGSRDELLERYASLADQLVGCGPVLDVGCGRGELLELLEARGVEASGVDTDPALVAECRDLGLNVRYGDGLDLLREAAPASLGGLALVQVIEHFTPQQVLDVVALAADRVRPGGRVVIETVNPQSLYVYAHAFYLDPTHVRPVHPAWLTFLFREAGFPEVSVDWRTPPDKDEVLEAVGDDAHDRNVARLNQVLFAPQDYAVVATR